jgi:hypothetical protein
MHFLGLELLLYRVLDLSQPRLVNYIAGVLDLESPVLRAEKESPTVTRSLISMLLCRDGRPFPALPTDAEELPTQVSRGDRAMFLRRTDRHIRLYLLSYQYNQLQTPQWQVFTRVLHFNPSLFELAVQTYSSHPGDHILMGMHPARLTLQFNRDHGADVDSTSAILSSFTHLTLFNTAATANQPPRVLGTLGARLAQNAGAHTSVRLGQHRPSYNPRYFHGVSTSGSVRAVLGSREYSPCGGAQPSEP